MSELGGSVGRLGPGGNLGPGGRMHHSHSTPAGVDGGSRTPPATPQKGGKMLAVRVQMLDDSVTMFQIQAKALGRVLFEQVCRQLHLLEADYFGLEYQEPNGTKYWLDLEKAVCRQVGLSLVEPVLRFCVKFYTPDPAQLEEEFTRYLFCLQIKRDLAQGVIQCNDNTAALMASYIVQAECGDYVSEDYPDHTYLSSYRFVPQQDQTLERRIMENHKKHAGQTPAEADLNLLETARRCELYGMKMHSAKDHEGVPLNLAVAHMGIVVFQHTTKINTFSWAKIRKISFKRKRFLVKLHPEGYVSKKGYYKDTVEFFFEGRNECKNFWKKCVENHGFFRCSAVKHVPRHKTRVLSRGSSFRYSGKTQKQIVEFVRDNYVKRQTFQRSQSFRHSSAVLAGPGSGTTSIGIVNNSVNASVSAHPLLPLADPVELASQVQPWNLTPVSQTTREACLPRSTHTGYTTVGPGVTAALVEPPPNIRMMSSPSPPLTTRSGSPVTSATWSPPEAHRAHSPHAEVVPGHQRVTAAMDSPCKPSDADSVDNSILSDNNNSYSVPSTPTTGAPLSPLNGNVTYAYPDSLPGKENTATKISADKTKGSYNVGDMERNLGLRSASENITEKSKFNIPREATLQTDQDLKKRKWPTDKAYFIAKEILMTERSYKKDLDVITTWFREDLSPEDEVLLAPLLAQCESLGSHHGTFLREIEHRLSLWEGRSTNSNHPSSHEHHRIGDVILRNMAVLPIYEEYLDTHLLVLEKLDNAFWEDSRFQQMYRDFEHQKVCYLPFTSFVLKPLQRILHYQKLLDRLLQHYPDNHFDREDCERAHLLLSRTAEPIRYTLLASENYTQLCELQRDLTGFDGLVQSGRKIIRIGCLLKHSTRGGLQQRMFFLFSDILLYASKPPAPQSFKVHGHVPLRALLLNDGESANSFVIFGGTRSITVSANTVLEKEKWVNDITAAVQEAKEHGDSKVNYLSLKSCSSSEEVMDTCGVDPSTPKVPAQRSNTALHVCWHRAATISMQEHLAQAENQLSGYLLRKFKNSSGWQKLWVVFTSFCLYFYKACQDDFPLASLPLLGYTVSAPSEQDSINKEFVFKLTFKNHVYFFRAESEHTYARWMEVIGSATHSPKY